MRVTMHEVNFGEAILYQEGDYKLLVDCGAKFGQRGQLAFNRVRNQIDDNTKLLITHFDEDHYNGIIQMSNTQKFDKIFLPLYIFRDGTVQNVIDVIKTWTYSIAIGREERISCLNALFLKLPKIVNRIDDIYCIGLDDSFFLERKRVDILWPASNFRIRRRIYADEMLQILRDSAVDDKEEAFEEFVELADAYVETFLRIYTFYCANGHEYIQQEVTNESFIDELENLRQAFERVSLYGINITLDRQRKKRINSILRMHINTMNECSVVFEVEDEIIALGDISSRIINHMRNNNLISHDEYKLVKVQHHGTHRYWTYRLPDAKVHLISNSGTVQMNWSIDKRYGLNYANAVMCTNGNPNRCGYYNTTRRCNNCNIGLNQTQIVVDCDIL